MLSAVLVVGSLTDRRSLIVQLQFIIHSPTLTSLKWWPTGMYASTHAVVMANLFLDGKNYGVQVSPPKAQRPKPRERIAPAVGGAAWLPCVHASMR